MFEMANMLIALFLLFTIMRSRDATTKILVLFVYGTLHFAFAAILLTSKESASLLIAVHNNGSGVLAKFSALLLLGGAFVSLSRPAYNVFLINRGGEKEITLHFLLVMGALLCGYIFNVRHGDGLQFKNFISFEVMLAFLLIGFLGTVSDRTLSANKIYSWGVDGLLIFVFIDCIAIFEVFSHCSWAGTLESSGKMVYRASSILFNPNLFAFWASLVYLGCAYGMHAYKEHRKMMLLGMVLASIAIFLSGSRSVGYQLLLVMFIPAVLLKERFHWLPLILLPLTMLTIYIGTVWLVIPFVSSNEGWHAIAALGERFGATPGYLLSYALMRVCGQFSVPSEVTESIEGRFVGAGSDGGWIVLYQDVGWQGTAAILWLCFWGLLWGVRNYRATRSASSVYALTTFCCCLLTGLIMRFEIFPVWLFISVVLTPCLALWARRATPSNLLIDSDARTSS